MRVVGFTFIRNAIRYEYPVVEAIQSIMLLCDEVVVAVGKSEDGTLELIQGINPEKIRIVETVWDDTLREGGRVLAEETNKAFRAIDSADWCFYIQGDEVVHELYHNAIRAAMLRWKDDTSVDGLLFKYLHFYGSYDYIGSSPSWYGHEIRVVRCDKSIYSYRDAQGFRKGNDEKLRVKAVDAFIYHYGWVKEPAAMQQKQEQFHKLWHDDAWVDQNVKKAAAFDYESHIDALEKFEGTHPAVMLPRIGRKNWQFAHDPSFNRLSFKKRLKLFAKKYLGLDFSYKNYKL